MSNDNIKSTTCPIHAFHPYFSTMLFNKLFTNDQTQSGTGFIGGAFAICLPVKFEQVLNDPVTHPDTRVPDGNFNRITSWRVWRDANLSARLGKFYSIADQVPEYGFKHVLVGKNNKIFRNGKGNTDPFILGGFQYGLQAKLNFGLQ